MGDAVNLLALVIIWALVWAIAAMVSYGVERRERRRWREPDKETLGRDWREPDAERAKAMRQGGTDGV